ncbi:hypothetical protein RR48_02307 [Papilio machaon]|uniref:Uncharacterized protein n=1 Tax=Papilio machaon TaxID=76193 RepID=A0A0N1PJB6_PAPMA|nr:hypothetical protein RR48_02307 [Papilio machaon]
MAKYRDSSSETDYASNSTSLTLPPSTPVDISKTVPRNVTQSSCSEVASSSLNIQTKSGDFELNLNSKITPEDVAPSSNNQSISRHPDLDFNCEISENAASNLDSQTTLEDVASSSTCDLSINETHVFNEIPDTNIEDIGKERQLKNVCFFCDKDRKQNKGKQQNLYSSNDAKLYDKIIDGLNQDDGNANSENVSPTRPPQKRRRTLTEITPDIIPYSKRLKMLGRLTPVQIDQTSPLPENFSSIQTIDLLHLLSYVFHVPNTPSWTGFNSRIIEDNSPTQKVSYLTPIKLSPTNVSVVAYTMEQAQNVGKECGQTYVQVTYDLAIAKIAYKIQATEGLKFSNLFIHLGSFHLMMAFFKAVGTFINECGLSHMMIESKIIASGSVNGILEVKKLTCIHPIERWHCFPKTIEVAIHLREAVSETGSELYPSCYKLKQAKLQRYPDKEDKTITDEGASIKLQALLNLTVSRLLDGNEENRIASENTLSLNETGNTVTDETTGTPFATPKPFRKRRRPEVEQDPTQQEAVNILQRMYESRKSRDENDAFGEYVSMKLKQIKNSHAKNTAQHHINNILYNATMGQYDFPTTFTDPTASSSWGYNSEPNLSTFSENNADCSSRGYYTAPSPSASFETSSSDNSRTHTRTSARTQSPSNLSESSQDSTQSLNDLLESIKN